jgi:hypothetical protein
MPKSMKIIEIDPFKISWDMMMAENSLKRETFRGILIYSQ